MSFAKGVGDNEIEGLSHCFSGGVTEDAFRPRIPELDDALCIRDNDRVALAREERSA